MNFVDFSFKYINIYLKREVHEIGAKKEKC